MESVKMSIDKRALHKREYENRVNERQMQTTKEEVDMRNDIDVDDADIKPVYDKELMAEVQLTTENNVFATGQQHTEQPEFNNEGEVDQNAEQCHDKRMIFTSSTTMVDNEPPHGSNTNLQECIQTLDSSAAQTEALKEETSMAENIRGRDKAFEIVLIGNSLFIDRKCVPTLWILELIGGLHMKAIIADMLAYCLTCSRVKAVMSEHLTYTGTTGDFLCGKWGLRITKDLSQQRPKHQTEMKQSGSLVDSTYQIRHFIPTKRDR
ncbi:hypothetical protein Tco_0519070 [Tanacetum coccineum]